MSASGTCRRRAERSRTRRATGSPPRRPERPRRPPASPGPDPSATAASAPLPSAPPTCPISPFRLTMIPIPSTTPLRFPGGLTSEAGRPATTTTRACFPAKRTGKSRAAGKFFGRRGKKSVFAVLQKATTSNSPMSIMRGKAGSTSSSSTTAKTRCSTKTEPRKGRKRAAPPRRKTAGRLESAAMPTTTARSSSAAWTSAGCLTRSRLRTGRRPNTTAWPTPRS